MLSQAIIDAVGRMSIEDIQELDALLGARWSQLQAEAAAKAAAKFYVGCPVWFTDKRGRRHDGVVQRINVKTLSIVTTTGQRWRVAPQFVHKREKS